ncbi:MAG TPA: type II toxin-antitoxin system VapC family toxin [Candidatus Acidoferrales bacterium]|nr:type II toxin-antitoxin system VapC family toxin [Candidatus Acidoferrales bacterium]
MAAYLFDSSVYINAFRGNHESLAALQTRQHSTNPVWLSSVVLEELFAGAGPKGLKVVEQLQRDFEKARRILVPALTDWAETGKVLRRLAIKYGYEQIGRARLTNDALIATSAGRVGVTVITANARDFARLSEFAAFTWSIPH